MTFTEGTALIVTLSEHAEWESPTGKRIQQSRMAVAHPHDAFFASDGAPVRPSRQGVSTVDIKPKTLDISAVSIVPPSPQLQIFGLTHHPLFFPCGQTLTRLRLRALRVASTALV